jgi:choline-sulfatase
MKGDNLQWKDNAFSEYLAHGVARPTAMLRQGRYKLHYSLGDQPQLYDLAQDPNEFSDLVLAKTHQGILQDLRCQLLSSWNPWAIEQQVLKSQQDRQLIEHAYRQIAGN